MKYSKKCHYSSVRVAHISHYFMRVIFEWAKPKNLLYRKH